MQDGAAARPRTGLRRREGVGARARPEGRRTTATWNTASLPTHQSHTWGCELCVTMQRAPGPALTLLPQQLACPGSPGSLGPQPTPPTRPRPLCPEGLFGRLPAPLAAAAISLQPEGSSTRQMGAPTPGLFPQCALLKPPHPLLGGRICRLP